MKRFFIFTILTLFTVMIFSEFAYARNRKGSFRVGGYNSAGKGSKYFGGY